MNPILLVGGLIIVIFTLVAAFKKMIPWKTCALCLAVSGTWVSLYALDRLGTLDVPDVLIAVLMGETITGVYKLLEKRLPEELHVFRLPFILTVTLVAYTLLVPSADLLATPGLILLALWLVFLAIYSYRAHPKVAGVVERIIACCRDWS